MVISKACARGLGIQLLGMNVKENVQQVEVLHEARRLEPVEPDVLVAKTKPVQ